MGERQKWVKYTAKDERKTKRVKSNEMQCKDERKTKRVKSSEKTLGKRCEKDKTVTMQAQKKW